MSKLVMVSSSAMGVLSYLSEPLVVKLLHILDYAVLCCAAVSYNGGGKYHSNITVIK